MLNAFNWDFIRDCPLPERQPAYVAQIITPCKIRPLKATEFARRTEVVFKFTLYATKKSLTPITLAPDIMLNSAGP